MRGAAHHLQYRAGRPSSRGGPHPSPVCPHGDLMAEDPYKVLGVPRDATEKQIRSAFLKLAKTSHPDLNPGDPAAEQRFKDISAAHDLLSDAERRGRYDRGEIDEAGQER